MRRSGAPILRPSSSGGLFSDADTPGAGAPQPIGRFHLSLCQEGCAGITIANAPHQFCYCADQQPTASYPGKKREEADESNRSPTSCTLSLR